MKKAFFINGGIGRVLCSIPALEWYKENVDSDVVIVSESWTELFLTSPSLRNNVWPMDHKGLFEEKLKDREIISPEPYRLNAYFNQKCNLIQAFDILINNHQEIPKPKKINIEVSSIDQLYAYNLISQIKKQFDKEKVVVFQPFGSTVQKDNDIIIDPSGRSFNVSDIITITKELSKHYCVIMMTDIDIPITESINAVIPKANILQWMGIIGGSDYFLGCDSMGQHYAHALNKPATIVTGATFPENITYPYNDNFTIIDNGKDKRVYSPIRITHDFISERINESVMVLENKTINSIISSVTDKLGKTKHKEKNKDDLAVPHIHGPNCKHNVQQIDPPFSKKFNS